MDEHYSSMADPTNPAAFGSYCPRIGVRVEDVQPNGTAKLGRESVELWSKPLVSWVPVAQLDHAINAATQQTVADLDAALTELWGHRERLADEYLRRTGQGLHCPPGSRILELLIKSEARLARLRAAAERHLAGPDAHTHEELVAALDDTPKWEAEDAA